MKKTTTAILFVLILCFGTVVFAAPSSIAPGAWGNTGSLIDITHPETIVSTTTQTDYVLSGVSHDGVAVTTYYYNYYTGRYEMMGYTSIVGASGYYAKVIRLNKGNNKILVRADGANGACELVYIEINLLVDTFWNKIRDSHVDVNSGVRSIFGE